MAGYRTPLGRARGLGAAKHGVGHFIKQRLTGAALVVLMLWAISAAIGLSRADFASTTAWLHSAWNAVPAALLIGTAFLHMSLGMQVIIEDYIQTPLAKISLLALNAFVCWAGAAIGVFSILKVAFGGGAY
ncbi:MAG: succinate dehydrogenase, hydrophobic membrane anchor protein [Caulobacteraceae bacterium]|nr:succinate dehydrogenase, hydrophobic membrane anchor protein [Caulobacteraceae bacterium]